MTEPSAGAGVDQDGVRAVALAGLAMLATFPGRSHGVSLLTEPLVEELGLTRPELSRWNFLAILIGVTLCVPIGRALDRFRPAPVLALTLALLAVATLGLSLVTGALSLLIALTAVRGLGQSGLSVLAIALPGKWYRRRLPLAMAGFATITLVGTALALGLTKGVMGALGWRVAWRGIAVGLLVLAVIQLRWLPDPPARPGDVAGTSGTEPDSGLSAGAEAPSVDFFEAVQSRAFLAFSLGFAIFNAASSGLLLFLENLLAERGEDLAASFGLVLICNVLGLLAGQLLAGRMREAGANPGAATPALAAVAVGLGLLARGRSLAVIAPAAALIGLAAGRLLVLFFSFYGARFGRRELGRIQGLAQVLNVLASATGPVIVASARVRLGSYGPVLDGFAVALLVCAGLTWLARDSNPPSVQSATPSQTVVESDSGPG